VAHKAKPPRPPCPGDVSGPPGHNKTTPPAPRPCNDAGDDHGKGAAGVILAPLALAGAALSLSERVRRRVRIAAVARRRGRVTRA